MSPSASGLLRIFGLPLLLALASSAGLLLALLGDGWLDALAWAGLGLPVLAVSVAWLRRTR